MSANRNENVRANQEEARDSSIAGIQGKEANCHIFQQLVIDGCVYQIHPIYDLHAASRDGKIIHIVKQVPNIGNKKSTGYIQFTVRKYGDKNQKT